ncbi:hypothetical protein NERG_01214 [Nematocida ausubeli]|uniref:Uncharacterized protein n=1 Tax=Nematocida ausubeli (strain ATCC PRA-371 / ERTm2) TaxID=1913371 RepID=H8ZBX1_NEMA1|nr:hypothetical protein NERG_01214 [Nematocida ausubeli]
MFSIMKSNLSKRKNQLLESKEVATEDLKVHRIRQEEKERAICRAKLYMLIGLAILCHVWDRILTVDGLVNVQVKADTITKEGSIDIGIKPVLKEEASDIGLIHSKRFFSPEIKIEHSITVTKNDSEYNSERYVPKDPIYTYTRNHRQDRVHLILPYEGELLKYKKEYFTTLLELFPSMHGYVSIWSDREDSFFSFINRVDVKEYKYKILASLLLLAEGVDVPLAINESQNGTELVLKKADEGEHFRESINALIDTKGEDAKHPYAHEEMCERGVVSVVNFFIENRESKVFTEKKGSSEPFLYKQFEKAQFVNSPAFLIQTYTRHCLESTEEVVLFRKIVHDLLNEYMEQEEAYLEDKQRKQNLAAQAKDMFSRYFILGKQMSNYPNYTNVIHPTKKTIYTHCVGRSIDLLYLEPVADVVPVPMKMNSLMHGAMGLRLPAVENTINNGIFEPIEGFTDYGETVLLGLLCAIAYDCEKHMCTIDHIESASKELKSFFQKHSGMYGAVSKELHDDWNQVVGGLKSKNIQYMRPDRNQLVPGIVNMLYVIKEITGVGDTKKINKFRKRLKRIEEEQKIQEVKLIYRELKKDTNNTEEKKNEMKLQILGVIDVKRLNKIRVLDEKLRKEKNRKEADEIKLKIQKLMNIDALYKSYIEKEEMLKTKLENDINKYLEDVIKPIAIGVDVTISICSIYKKTVKKSCSEILGRFGLYRGEESSCYYNFSSWSRYTPKEIELKFRTTFNLQKEPCSLENKQSGVFERNALARIITELKRKSRSNENYEFYPTLFYLHECNTIDIYLIDPLMHIQKHKIYIIWALLLHAIDRNLGSDHPFVRLADNLLESARFMYSDKKNEMFMLLNLISVDKYYPHITIDKHTYENEKYFAKVIENLLELANSTALVSHKLCADIITKLIIKLLRTFRRDNEYSGLECFFLQNCGISKAKSLFAKILTLDGSTMEYITRIVQSTQGMGNEDPADGCTGYINVLLMWIIQNANESRCDNWQDIAKECYNLIDVTKLRRSDFINCSMIWNHSIYIPSLFPYLKPIVCVEHDAESVERFRSIEELFNELVHW